MAAALAGAVSMVLAGAPADPAPKDDTAATGGATGVAVDAMLAPILQDLDEAERVAEMKIWVDTTTFLPRQLQYVESDGDSTLLAFQDIRTNVAVDASRFHLDLPKDVVVSESFNGFSLGEQSF